MLNFSVQFKTNLSVVYVPGIGPAHFLNSKYKITLSPREGDTSNNRKGGRPHHCQTTQQVQIIKALWIKPLRNTYFNQNITKRAATLLRLPFVI